MKPEIEITVAWWLTPYFYVLAFLCAIFGTEADEGKLNRVIARAMRAKVVDK